MSILSNISPSQSALDWTLNELQNGSARSFSAFCSSQDQLANLFWNNPTGLTPQQVSEALGTSAAAFFAGSAAAATFRYQMTGIVPEIVPDGYSFTINTDGTVPITYTPASSSSSESSESSEPVNETSSGR